MTKVQLDKQLTKWHEIATNEERRLAEKAKRFEDEYFKDMTFRPGTFIHDYFIHEPVEDEDGFEGEGGFNIDTLGISIASCRFKVSRLRRKFLGSYSIGKRIITISAEKMKDDDVLLHEMIHAYEDMLLSKDYFGLRLTLRELLTHFLDKDLSKKIKNLEDVIHEFIHIRPYDDKTPNGRFHSFLFLLKSLELDLRLGKKPGTVFEYGLAKYIKGE